jgi:phosphoglucomutase
MSNVREIARYWAEAGCFDEKTRQEAQRLLQSASEAELEDRFGQILEFGTGGLRGMMGVGTNRMNRYTVMQASEGLARYIEKQADESASGIVIGYDSRNYSKEFAHAAAEVFAKHGIPVYLFEDIAPTPLVSYALLQKKAVSAIILTASHNPPEYNGYKVYWRHGGQIVPPDDALIIEEVRSVEDISEIPRMAFSEAVKQGRIEWIDASIDEEYRKALLPVSFGKTSQNQNLQVIYTPLHGTGGRLVPKLLEERNFGGVHCVSAQMVPDGNFTTVKSPNPEDAAAFQMAMEESRPEHRLILANDPDADRLGVMVRDAEQNWVRLNGNQIGVLLLDFVLSVLKEDGKLSAKQTYVASIVTSPLGKAVAQEYGLKVVEVLTGFKWIWQAARNLEQDSTKFLFGMEESHGYLMGDHCGDKDGVWAAMAFSEMIAALYAQGCGPLERLEQIYTRHGFHVDALYTQTLPGAEGKAQIRQLLQNLRENPPATLGDNKLLSLTDLLTNEVKRPHSESVTPGPNLPPSNVLLLELENDIRVIVRPSGTEPKIKYYFNLKGARDVLPKRLQEVQSALGLSV